MRIKKEKYTYLYNPYRMNVCKIDPSVIEDLLNSLKERESVNSQFVTKMKVHSKHKAPIRKVHKQPKPKLKKIKAHVFDSLANSLEKRAKSDWKFNALVGKLQARMDLNEQQNTADLPCKPEPTGGNTPQHVWSHIPESALLDCLDDCAM